MPSAKYMLDLGTGKHALLFALLRCFKLRLTVAAIPRLAAIGFTYSQPFLVNRVIDFVGDESSTVSLKDGNGLIGATALVYIGVTVRQTSRCFLQFSDASCRS